MKMGDVETTTAASGMSIHSKIKFSNIPCVPKEKRFGIKAVELMNETFSLKTDRGELIPVRLQIILLDWIQKYNFVLEVKNLKEIPSIDVHLQKAQNQKFASFAFKNLWYGMAIIN